MYVAIPTLFAYLAVMLAVGAGVALAVGAAWLILSDSPAANGARGRLLALWLRFDGAVVDLWHRPLVRAVAYVLFVTVLGDFLDWKSQSGLITYAQHLLRVAWGAAGQPSG